MVDLIDHARAYWGGKIKGHAGSVAKTQIRLLQSQGKHDQAEMMRQRAGISPEALAATSSEPPPLYRETWRRYERLTSFRRTGGGFGLQRLVLSDIFEYWDRSGAVVPMIDVELSAYTACENVLEEMVSEIRERENRKATTAPKPPRPRSR